VKHRIAFINLPLLAVFLVLASTTALASNTWYVNGVNGSNNNNCKSPQTACKTIGHAISLASSGDSIMVAAATYTENLKINLSMKVIGSGAVTTIIDGGGKGTVVTISNASAHVALSMVSIFNGRALQGGGIANGGTLTMNNTTVSGSGIRGIATFGGGILNGGTLTMSNSTISGNVSSNGGGIFNSGTLTISNSTISGNGASGKCVIGCISSGGGINNKGTLTISNSTISGNGAVFSVGGGIAGTVILQNSIVANNLGGNCSGTMTSNGYNLSSDGTCNFNKSGDLNNTDPKLGPLQNNGGPTQTIPLLSGSPAIDAGNPNGCTDGRGHLLKTDQRGRPRPDKEDSGGCDMGAYERQND
jgi:hypothetical protein